MFCEKCGRRIESGERFCPVCGTKVAAFSAVPAYTGKVRNEVSDVLGRLILSCMGFSILAWTFFPFVNLQTGTLERLAGSVLGRNIGNIGVNLYGIKAAVVGLSGFLGDEGRRSVSLLNAFVSVAIIVVLVTALLAFMSGIMNNKGFLMVSGIASALCLGMWIAYLVYVRSFFEQVNSFLGEHAAVNGFYGIGLIMLMISLAAHMFFAIYKSIKM